MHWGKLSFVKTIIFYSFAFLLSFTFYILFFTFHFLRYTHVYRGKTTPLTFASHDNKSPNKSLCQIQINLKLQSDLY